MQRRLSLLIGRRCGQHVIDQINAIHPAGMVGMSAFQAVFDDDDPDLIEIQSILGRHGCKPIAPYVKGEGLTYFATPSYIYHETELQRGFMFRPQCQSIDILLHLPSIQPNTVSQAPPVIRLRKSDKPKSLRKHQVFNGFNHCLVVTPEMKGNLESAGLTGLRFDPTSLALHKRHRGQSWSEPAAWEDYWPDGPLWTMSSDHVLPRVSPRCRLVTTGDKVVADPGHLGSLYLAEGEWPAGELHYRLEDMTDAPLPDITVTHEPFGSRGNDTPVSHSRCILVSPRIRELFKHHKIDVKWTPAYLD